MLTTTLDGLWVLQSVTGIEQLCPELGLRPLLPRLDTAEQALRHPIAEELTEIGALDGLGEVDPMIREWLTVIMRRDVALLVTLNFPGRPYGDPAHMTRVSINRFASWWVVLERHDQEVRLYPAGTAGDQASAGDLLVGQIERLCGVTDSAPLRPVTLDTKELLERVRDREGLRKYLADQRLDIDQQQTVMAAADPEVSGQANIVALQPGAGPEDLARMAIGDTAVMISDTPAGRVCVENIDNGGRRYQIVSPGTRTDVANAILRLISRLPAGADWHSHRRVV
ncbi:ESX secretion-associated protein EspG [Mycolicibacter sp. MYC123]|uniref:ESX secretion-associated protein EspG n=1 Tax=[Mycobacterium] zoologicum TaxID=2872311 RepID=A0ABU5YJ82_9MYCO|nr:MULTISPECIES: ESX secretion-associated protein EspG [unclassified Mycolicibacter]MEB3049901.1 ESX secretion-associated protein EspG [Mycolicibacter sp. MYC123]MEB3063237.1 ESX secretion-associated protein EspG [Mycolicibacter sp. MYC101]